MEGEIWGFSSFTLSGGGVNADKHIQCNKKKKKSDVRWAFYWRIKLILSC